MLGGLGGLNPAKMKSMMKQLGIKQDEIEADRVIIESSGKRIVIEPVNVQKIVMQGQTSWQVTGEAREENKGFEINEDDLSMIMEKTGVSKDKAREALEETKDIAEAIVKLSD